MPTAHEVILRWRRDPVAFVRENFGIEPDAWQKQSMEMVKPEGITRLCLKACAGPGKSAELAWLGWHRMACFAAPGEHPKGAALSTTADNLRDNLWPELAKWQQRSAFLRTAFTWQKERIFANDHPETWFLAARSFNKAADPQEQGRSLSGLHSQFPFILIDESGDIVPAVGRAAEQAMGNCVSGLIAQAGNPTSQTGLLYESAVTRRDAWSVVSITADPDDPMRTPRVSKEWAAEQIAKYGRDNPWVMAYILGLFPPGGLNALLAASFVEQALGRHMPPETYRHEAKIIGVDVARFGDDSTELVLRQGRVVLDIATLRGADTFTIAARAARMYNEHDADAIHVDGSGGYGAGVVDSLKQAKLPVREVQFGGSPIDPRYFNKRSEMWFEMAEWFKAGAAVPNEPMLVAELSLPTYTFQGSKFRLEEKEQIKQRLGRSPDKADGLALTFAFPVVPRKRILVPGGGARVNSNFDPTA